ncbi:MAG TPA: GGDEF domain-containing protein [Gammaproteobacteria bacterium]|nr:GGDEF domain-containing protein [Gammaproteobacteria bacterium]
MSEEQEVWKDKYFKSLEELELKEKDWSSIESLLRTAVSRMSIAISGVDDDLDDQLNRLRKSIRDNQDSKQLDSLIRQITNRLEKIESERKPESQTDIAVVLESIIAQIELPRGTARAEKSFRKSIKRYKPGDAHEAVRQDFIDLIKQCLIQSAANAEEVPKEAAEKSKGGLFSRFRKTGKNEDNHSVTEAADGSDVDELQSGRRVLTQLIDSLSRAGQTVATDVKTRLNQASVQPELNKIVIELASSLGGQSQGADTPHHDEMSLNEAFLRLLELIELDEEGANDLEALQTRLHKDVPDEEWPQVLADIAALVTGMRNKVHDEKKEFENFLSQLTSRLSEVDASFKQAEGERVGSYERGIELGETVRDHVQDIKIDVRDASDLDSLKTSVKQRMELLGEHMQQFREDEDQRNTRAEEHISELNERLRHMEQEAGSLRQRVIDERERARRDRLTGLYNRHAYDERMAQEYARWQRYHEPLSMLVLDIDYFKKINDQFGHIAGDKVLRSIAQKLTGSVRETDMLARYGGEEFVLIMPATPLQEAVVTAEKCRAAIAGMAFHFRDENVPITVSAGVTTFDSKDDPLIAFERADKALYQAKQAGRNCCKSL